MKLFTDANQSRVFAFDADGSQDDYIPAGLVPITAEQANVIRAALLEPQPVLIVSPFQAKAALLVAGLLATVEAAIAQADPLAQLAWSEAVEFRRDSPTVASMATTLGLTEQQLDDLFTAASQVTA